jgi:hypothetical protein
VVAVLKTPPTAAGILVARRWQLRWGATVEESGEILPGDDLISDPDLAATRAITVGAAAGQVWPWIAQLGQGRGGFYSYDFLENLVGCDIHGPDQIVPGWQDVEVGDQIRLAPSRVGKGPVVSCWPCTWRCAGIAGRGAAAGGAAF